MDIYAYRNIIGSRESIYFLRQVMVIVGLFTAGLIPSGIIRKRLPRKKDMLLAFPLGLSLFGVMGFLLLIIGIRLSVHNIIVFYLLLMAALIAYVRLRPSDAGQELYYGDEEVTAVDSPDKGSFRGTEVKKNAWKDAAFTAAGYAVVIMVAFFSCSGILSQIVTNDSVYYYSMYPSILVHDGFITASLDKYLTDVGQTTAVIQCLPFLFDFDQSFGIQHFLNCNFVLIFFAALYEALSDFSDLCKPRKGKELGNLCKPHGREESADLCKPSFPNLPVLAAALPGTLFLVSCEPFIVLSKWILSNVYFMDFLFIVFLLELYSGGGGRGSDNAFVDRAEERLLDFRILFMNAFLIMSRMEGGVLVFVLALAFSVLPIKKEKLLLHFALPLCIMELGYYGMIYLRIGIDPLYSFLDSKTALLMAGLIVALAVYIIFIRDRIKSAYLPVLLLVLLALGNAGLLLINSGRYLTNLKAFFLNVRLGNGWGLFSIIIVIYCAMLIFELVRRRGRDIPVMLFLPAALVLAIIAVCFARGGVLAVRTSDSGNRVLMEIVPLLVFSVFVQGVLIIENSIDNRGVQRNRQGGGSKIPERGL